MDMAVFPGTQGGPLEHVIAAKAIAFGEILTDEFTDICQTDHRECTGHECLLHKKRIRYCFRRNR